MAENEKNEQAEPLAQRLQSKSAYPVVYMFIVTFFFTIILVGFSTATRERVEANRRIMRERALLLAVFPDEIDESMPLMEVHQIFQRRVKPPEETDEDHLYTIVDEDEDDEVIAYALELDGMGFWDRIAGFIGLETDRETIISIAFYDQTETPGLGGEIESLEFREQFEGKKLSDEDIPFRLVSPAEETDENSVHAISGATQTCNRLERIIINDVNRWREGRER